MWKIAFAVAIIIFIPLAAKNFPLDEYRDFVGYTLYIFVFTVYLCALTISNAVENKDKS